MIMIKIQRFLLQLFIIIPLEGKGYEYRNACSDEKHGKNTHHIIEAVFKGFGRALGEASRRDLSLTGVPSSKGIVDSVN